MGRNRHIEVGVREGRWGRGKGPFHASNCICQKLGGKKLSELCPILVHFLTDNLEIVTQILMTPNIY